jgi:hypothetical protein
MWTPTRCINLFRVPSYLRARSVLTRYLGWGAPGGDILVRHLRFRPRPSQVTKSICEAMLRELLLLAVILALIIGGILPRFLRPKLRALP